MDHLEKEQIKTNGSVCGMKNKHNNKGFGLIEILLVLMLFSLVVSIISPAFLSMFPYYERQQFLSRFNRLVQYAWQQAIASNTIHRVHIDIKKRRIAVEIPDPKTIDEKKPTFLPVKQGIISGNVVIPKQLEIKQFFVNGIDELSRFSSGKSSEVWFFVDAKGIVQPVVINMTDTKDLLQQQPRQMSLILNPFDARFTMQDGFAKG